MLAELNLLEQQLFPLINFLKIFSPIIVLDDESTVTRNLKTQVGASEAKGMFYSLLAECYLMNDIKIIECNKIKRA